MVQSPCLPHSSVGTFIHSVYLCNLVNNTVTLVHLLEHCEGFLDDRSYSYLHTSYLQASSLRNWSGDGPNINNEIYSVRVLETYCLDFKDRVSRVIVKEQQHWFASCFSFLLDRRIINHYRMKAVLIGTMVGITKLLDVC